MDYPTVRTSLAFHITTKKGMAGFGNLILEYFLTRADLVVVANGVHEKDEVLDETRVTSHWRLEQRCPSYLICWAVGDFQIGKYCLFWHLFIINGLMPRRTRQRRAWHSYCLRSAAHSAA